ncbi:class I SAM-dependent methyltransferase [Neisseria sp. Ec49-e6-T10]|uniref:class I SAM-dependent methyltransferase n=1 Tax=Neisseria sp. Ec49-e6-T10 TaxID=3140744 RepID=UPI003EC0E51C
MSDITAFANRLGKNLKHLIKWAKRQQLQAWRAYDKDVPQYPFIIDIYKDHIHLQEYDTGWLIHADEYQQWISDVIDVIIFITGFPKENIHFKSRTKQKGLKQYEKTGQDGKDFIVEENHRQFWVNLDKYLDTGLFLDHRNTRKRVGDLASGKRFLNLFSYTGSFTVYAATAGAVFSETVDLSNTYLAWAKKNFELNNINLEQHKIIRDDVFAYLNEAIKDKKQFDLIVMDPPSFSNSKKMVDILDVQRDHAHLIDCAMKLLSQDGVLFFSNNLRTFELDQQIKEHYYVNNITQSSIPEDFRNKKIHQCFEIKLKS